MNITLPAHYLGDDTLFAAQLCFNPNSVRALQTKVKELTVQVPDFREIVVRFSGRVDFIFSVPDPDIEALFLNEAGTNLIVKAHAEPISNELFDSENAVRTVNLHVTQEGFYVKGFHKSGDAMETELVKLNELDSLIG